MVPSSRGAEPSVVLDARTLRILFITGRVLGIPATGIPAWVEDRFGLRISGRRFQAAVGPVRAENPHRKRPGPKGTTRLIKERPILRDTVAVDEPELGLKRILFRLANDGLPQPDLLTALDGLPGVRQVLEVDSTREVLIVALVTSDEEAADLRARLEDLAPGRAIRKDTISFESQAAAGATWARIASQVAPAAELN